MKVTVTPPTPNPGVSWRDVACACFTKRARLLARFSLASTTSMTCLGFPTKHATWGLLIWSAESHTLPLFRVALPRKNWGYTREKTERPGVFHQVQQHRAAGERHPGHCTFRFKSFKHLEFHWSWVGTSWWFHGDIMGIKFEYSFFSAGSFHAVFSAPEAKPFAKAAALMIWRDSVPNRKTES